MQTEIQKFKNELKTFENEIRPLYQVLYGIDVDQDIITKIDDNFDVNNTYEINDDLINILINILIEIVEE